MRPWARGEGGGEETSLKGASASKSVSSSRSKERWLERDAESRQREVERDAEKEVAREESRQREADRETLLLRRVRRMSSTGRSSSRPMEFEGLRPGKKEGGTWAGRKEPGLSSGWAAEEAKSEWGEGSGEELKRLRWFEMSMRKGKGYRSMGGE